MPSIAVNLREITKPKTTQFSEDTEEKLRKLAKQLGKTVHYVVSDCWDAKESIREKALRSYLCDNGIECPKEREKMTDDRKIAEIKKIIEEDQDRELLFLSRVCIDRVPPKERIEGLMSRTRKLTKDILEVLRS